VLVGREIATAPDPLGMARRLSGAGRRRVALLHAAERGGAFGRFSYVAADPDRRSAELDPLAADPDRAPPGSALGAAPRWIGVVPYEARRGLERAGWGIGPPRHGEGGGGLAADRRPPALLSACEWHRYPAVARVDHEEGRVLIVGTGRVAVDRLAEALLAPLPPPPGRLAVEAGDDEPPAEHAARIAIALGLIARGDLYQVNLARRLWIRLRSGDPLQLYESLSRRAPAPFGAYLELDDATVVSTSPELLLRAEPPPAIAGEARAFGAISTIPIKGTRPRGRDAEEDRALARALDEDPKERAELTMIVDVERNDLGRVAEVGSVRLASAPAVATHRTVHHRAARVTARARAGASREEVLAAMLPSGSVTGAPKVRAMEVIAALEPRRRGLYTGGLGFVAHDGGVTLSMAIRTAVIAGGRGEYWTGGGIVADSDPEREVEETRWKALQLQRAAEGA
jgi:anthranilate/para-aminobenzoate synthase component I